MCVCMYVMYVHIWVCAHVCKHIFRCVNMHVKDRGQHWVSSSIPLDIITIIIIFLFTYLVSVEGVHAMVCLWRLEESLQESLLPPLGVQESDSGDESTFTGWVSSLTLAILILDQSPSVNLTHVNQLTNKLLGSACPQSPGVTHTLN